MLAESNLTCTTMSQATYEAIASRCNARSGLRTACASKDPRWEPNIGGYMANFQPSKTAKAELTTLQATRPGAQETEWGHGTSTGVNTPHSKRIHVIYCGRWHGKIKGIRNYMLPKPLGWLKGCFESGLSAPAKQKQIQRNHFDVMLCVCEVKPLPN